MVISDIVSFKKESYFSGAVQTDWFYDANRIESIAASYVFHGPKYYGVSNKDISSKTHKLIDTASFAKRIAEKLYGFDNTNDYVMTIAGYGTGKSHLAVTLGALFGKTDIQQLVINNISSADEEIGSYLQQVIEKKNFVVALNGMNNFNLDAEVLKCVRQVLVENGIDESVLTELTQTYEISKTFVKRNFDLFCDKFNYTAAKYGLKIQDSRLKNYLIKNVESDNNALNIISTVYNEITGDNLRWERGISAGDVLTFVSQHFCGPNKPFNKVLVLFDEFGRYIEYTAASPAIAGEAALQQIFEAIQNSDHKIIFVGFIQSELDSYLQRIDKTANIVRYVGRYKASENLFLSTNFETILANLINKNEKGGFSSVVGKILSRNSSYYMTIHRSLLNWDRSNVQKNIWLDENMFRRVILYGCFPLHPITVWLLGNTSSWMQQRSTISFVAEMLLDFNNKEIDESALPYIFPTDIIDSSIYKEMLNSEEKGLVQSQFCMLYRDILTKIENKLSEDETEVLKAILVVNIARFKFRDKNDANRALKYCSGLSENTLLASLKSLEELHGVVAFDETANTYDLLADANGVNEFQRIYNKYRVSRGFSISDLDDEMRSMFKLQTDIETSFAQDHSISSSEWRFKKDIVDIKSVDEPYLSYLISVYAKPSSYENARGTLVYLYSHGDVSDEINRITALCKHLRTDKYPIIFILIEDDEEEILNAISVKQTISRFMNSDAERFKKHIDTRITQSQKKAFTIFLEGIQKQHRICEKGLVHFSERQQQLCSAEFERLFPEAIPFTFDGFDKKVTAQARKSLTTICQKMFDRSLFNLQSYQGLLPKDKNRIKACLEMTAPYSWKVLSNDLKLVIPQNEKVLRIFQDVESQITENRQSVKQIFEKYTYSPYGLNEYSLALFVFYYIAFSNRAIVCYFNNEKLKIESVTNIILKDGKVKYSDLWKIQIQRNMNADIDPVEMVCNKVLNNVYVEACLGLQDELNDILVQEGESDSNKYAIAQARLYLDEGFRLRNRIYDILKKAEEALDENEKVFKFSGFYKIFDYLDIRQGIIEDGKAYIYKQSYLDKLEAAKKRLNALIKGKYVNALYRYKTDITRLVNYQGICKRNAKYLEDNGFKEYAELTIKYMDEVSQDLKIKQKYISILEQCNQECSRHNSPSEYTYSQCEEALATIKYWEDFFKNNTDITGEIKKEYSDKVKSTKDALQKRQNQIEQFYVNEIDGLKLCESKSGLQLYRAKLSQLLQQGLQDSKNSIIIGASEEIEKALNLLGTMPDQIDELKTVVENFDTKQFVYCGCCILSEYKNNLRLLLETQQKWYQNYILPIEQNVVAMNANECMKWLEKTSPLPEYLQTDIIKRYNKAEEMVNNQLKNCHVQGVLTMFKALTLDEKAVFISLINSLY